MEFIILILIVLAVFYSLKFIARLMQQDNVQDAGVELDLTLDETVAKAADCLFRGCIWYLLLCVLGVVLGVVGALLHTLLVGLNLIPQSRRDG